MLERFIRSVQSDGVAQRVEDETPDAFTRMLDFVTLGLRLREGISFDTFRLRFSADLRDIVGDTLQWLARAGFIQLDESRVRVAAEHQLILNEILVHLEEPLRSYVRRETSDSQIVAR